ncbi:MAG: DUF1329 domain-containing protein [Oceanococcaceae bacterium]
MNSVVGTGAARLSRAQALSVMGLILSLVGIGFMSPAAAEDLTPVGAEAAAWDDAPFGLRIPPWTGGWVDGKPDQRTEDIPAPHAYDTPLFTITASNHAQYAELLSEGQKALFATYPETFTMTVYPSRRTATMPADVLQASVDNRGQVELVNQGSGFEGAVAGVPFPEPTSGIEAMWNHVARYRTTGFRGYVNSAVTTKSGDFVVERSYIDIVFGYNNPEMMAAASQPMIGWILAKVTAPATKVGDAYLLHVPLDRSESETLVWVYNPGTRKTRRIGEVGFDNPAWDGLMTQDQIDMFNGPFDRYDFKLIGKKPMLVPYNTERLHSSAVKYEDIITPGHPNAELIRYELHRMWVVEATLKEGASHIYARRIFYIDEDSWLVLMQDIYDKRGEFWRYGESYARQYPQIPLLVNAMQTHYDLQSRRYVILNMTNEEPQDVEYDHQAPLGHFTSASLQRFASRRH